ncbi:hypothetical protein CEUSTIGMA_g6947.t1 [Chlamydomonas eustigma]|uniref:4-aminobutyrate aminotransferase n=1 Tax=Chlamydomonas eustigma TaxID=1157962 RepID=A0A250X8W2_9CHLO|nr:hypothetical protein CEUSTIGMA_g6947.t1 [Chlamydomonas eustigma]|eukprot:GAX79506.1 hypothetical protein CEUSTIGMA_g6947.t1 [Chlamydomonas eustigma]
MSSSSKSVAQALSKFYTQSPAAVSKLNDFIAKRGEGSWVWTTEGRKLLDMTSGIGVTSTGHCHPTVVKAVQEQAATIVHAQQNIFGSHEKAVELYDKFSNGVMPSHLSRYFLCNSGAEAVDNAIKIVRSCTGRQNIIAFDGGYHGRTIGSMSLTTSKTVYRQGFGPLMPGVFVAPYPNCLHCKTQAEWKRAGYHIQPSYPPFDAPDCRKCCGSPAEALEWMLLMQTAPMDTAAVILEPVLGEGGFLSPPPGFMKNLRAICDKHGIMVIADEVQSGAARTGKWWGHQQFDDGGMRPDLMIFAKGMASGYPFAGVAARADAFEKMAPGTMGGTYGGNAVACAAAVATIEVIEKEGLLRNAHERGIQLTQGILDLANRHPTIIDVRGRGLMVGVEFGSKDGGLVAPKGIATAVAKACIKHDMLLMTAGARECVRFLPSLNISAAEVDIALKLFGQALDEVVGK